MGERPAETDDRRSESPDFEFDGGRPFIKRYNNASKYRPGQLVYLRIPGQRELEGPFKISSVPKPKTYTLAHPDGQQARDGAVMNEEYLTEAQ